MKNAGFGATYGCPIASLMVEKYLNDTIANDRIAKQKKMIETDLIQKYQMGKNMPITTGH